MRIVKTVGTWAIVAAGAACHGATTPPAFAGDYHLASVNDVALPAPEDTGTEVLDGTLHLDTNGDWMLTRHQRSRYDPAFTSQDTLGGHWAASGSDITLYFATTPVIQARATYEPPDVVVAYISLRYRFVPN